MKVHEGRAVGFGREETPFFAEVSFVAADGGTATVREHGLTEWGARERALRAAAGKLTSRRRRSGFTANGEYRTPDNHASFAFGFA